MNRNDIHNESLRQKELLQRYFNGKASPDEQHELEMLALEDPMLAEAMEGFELNPDAVGSKWFNSGGNNTLIAVVLASIVILAGGAFFLLRDDASTAQQATVTAPKIETDKSPVAEPEVVVIESHTTDSSVSITLMEQEQNIPETPVIEDETPDAFVTKIEAPEPVEPQEPSPIDASDDVDRNPKKPGAAIYHVYDYKLVDYRGLRKNHWEEEAIQSGTPASESGFDTANEPLLPSNKVKIAYVDYLQKTMEYFASDNMVQANRRFRVILRHFPEDANALFYGGLAAHYLGENEHGLKRLSVSEKIDIETFHEESRYYAAQCLWELGKKEEAAQEWRKIATDGGFYAEQAEEKLTRIK